MKMYKESEKNVVLMKISGEISEDSWPNLALQLDEMRKSNTPNIVLDLGHVEHINYKVVGRLIDMKKEFQKVKGDIRLVNVSPYLFDIFRLYGFYPFEIYPTRRAVIKSFNAKMA